jgi:hypothetical protein
MTNYIKQDVKNQTKLLCVARADGLRKRDVANRQLQHYLFFSSPGMGSNLAVKVRYGLGSGNH